jgi:uncharacterized membrane protein
LSKPIRSAYCLVFALLLAGCGGDDEKAPLEGAATGATCGNSTLTYDNFGRNFFTTYCRRCHSADAADRHGAPGSVNFDTVEQIRANSARIDELAALGPDAENEAMPPSGITPTDPQRDDLGRWLACGAP